jgi:hypothetical protein
VQATLLDEGGKDHEVEKIEMVQTAGFVNRPRLRWPTSVARTEIIRCDSGRSGKLEKTKHEASITMKSKGNLQLRKGKKKNI